MSPILQRSGGVWIGWTGEETVLDAATRDRLLAQSGAEYQLRPVEMDPDLGARFYEGYPNQTIWPLFHYFPERMRFLPESWSAYVEGNRRFCDAVVQEHRPGDLVWVHDYHLMLLPEMLRARLPEARIGFFLHIPFPSSEVFSMAPRGAEVLRGLLGADLIAFHTHRHLHHFRSSLLRLLSLDSGIDALDLPPRRIHLQAMPIGIAPDELLALVSDDPETAAFRGKLDAEYQGRQVIVGVDRMDYSKGIPQRLRAFRRLFEKEPDLKSKVLMVQVAVPSRENIESYQDLRSEVNELVGEINGKIGAAAWTPVVYINRGISRPELAALYQRADVACVTPLRDGMNLVAKEYCACKPAGDGVLVLSEFAGAAAEMGEALLVNPFDEEHVAETLLRALAMPDAERRERMRALHNRVHRKTVFAWAEDFVRELIAVDRPTPPPLAIDRHQVVDAYAAARRRVILLDYDGTLAGFTMRPEDAVPTRRVLGLLAAFAADPANRVALVSGRRAADLESWFGAIPGLLLVAEHAALVRESQSAGWRPLQEDHPAGDWKEKVRPILEHYVDRTPGSFIEEKDYSLAWHHRRVEPEFGEWLAGELAALLEELLANTEARPLRGRKVIEVRPFWANKGEFVSWIATRTPDANFWFAAGDDRTDEDMFARVPEAGWTVHVGPGPTGSKATVPNSAALIDLLDAMQQTRARAL
jgi:trehalose 6-phosphate synthase/phosphatase